MLVPLLVLLLLLVLVLLLLFTLVLLLVLVLLLLSHLIVLVRVARVGEEDSSACQRRSIYQRREACRSRSGGLSSREVRILPST